MPSLFKNVGVKGSAQVSVSAITANTVGHNSELADDVFDRAVHAMAEALFAEKWKGAQTELSISRGQMLAEVDAERKRVFDLAQREGFSAGEARARAQADQLMAEVQAAYRLLDEDRVRFLEENRKQIVELVLTVAQEFIREQFQNTPELLINMVSAAVQELVSKRKVAVFVHPSRVEIVSAYSYLLPGTADGKEIIIRPDPSLDVDSFRAEDDSGAIVSNLPEQFKRARLVLTDV